MPTDQAAVILVHGATLNARSWDPVRRLIDPRLRVLAPDTPDVLRIEVSVEPVYVATHQPPRTSRREGARLVAIRARRSP